MSTYFKEKTKKDKAVLHHTGGSHNPHWTVDGWVKKADKVSTAYVVGGKANSAIYEDLYDGAIIEHFSPDYWAYQLGIKEKNHVITKACIGIELCNYGQLFKSGDKYLNHVGSYVPKEQVVECKFRGYDYYEAYSEKQIISLRKLLIDLSIKYDIDLHDGLYTLIKKHGKKAFDYAATGAPGVWTHTNFRSQGKWDCSPQDILVDMILSF